MPCGDWKLERPSEVPRVTLRELKNFKHRINPEERQGAYGLYFIRPWSLFFTYLALNLGLSANQVTVLQIVAGMAGALCLAFTSPAMLILGIVLLQAGFVLDNVDGEVARFRKQVSISGKFLDTVGHALVIPSIYFSAGVGLYFRLGHFETVIFGFLAALFTLRLDMATLYQEAAQLIESKLDQQFDYYARLIPGKEVNIYRRKNEESAARLLYAVFAYPAIMNIIAVILFVDFFISPFRLFGYQINVLYLFILTYGALLPVRRAYTIYLLVRNRETERKYATLLELLRSAKDSAVKEKDDAAESGRGRPR